MEKNIEDEAENVIMSFAFVFRGKLKDFYRIKKEIENTPGVNLVYMTKSTEHLYIEREGEINDRNRRY